MKRKNNVRGFAFDLKRIEITAIVAFLLLLTSATFTSALSSSATSSSPEAQAIRVEIATLLEQVEKLKQQLRELQQGATSTSTPQNVGKPKRICPLIARALLAGARGGDVANLQTFLAEEGYFDRKNISSYFGPLTQSALRKWQAAQGIVSSGDAATTGWGAVGPRTKEFILKRCGGLPLQGSWNEHKPFSIPPMFGTTTWPGMQGKGPSHSAVANICPVPTMPPLASCDGKLRLEWKSTGDSMKCLTWKCHSDDDDDVDEDSDDDSDDDADDDSDDDTDDDDDTATSTDSD